jgi:hypothetical protein
MGMKKRYFFVLIFFVFVQIFGQNQKIKVFLSCRCDDDFLKQNTLFFDYVRDMSLSDIEVFVFEITNASGGRNYTFNFNGKNNFINKENKINAVIPQNISLNKSREILLNTYKLGMASFLSNTDYQNEIDVNFTNEKTITDQKKIDTWKNWVFEVFGSFNLENEQSINEEEFNLGFDIDRVTDIWRLRSDFELDRSVKFFSGGEQNYSSERERIYFSGSLVRSISNHFSTGFFSSYTKDTFRNLNSQIYISPALEYNFIPYNQVLTREVTLAYKLGYNIYNYIEETIYEFEDQKIFNHSLTLNLRFREKWGSIYSYLVASQFLDLPEQNRLTLNNSINLRIVRGLSLRISAYFRFIRDQISLPKGEASVEDLLLRQRQISTNYQNRISMGLSYTFGSIFNNIVNNRL